MDDGRADLVAARRLPMGQAKFSVDWDLRPKRMAPGVFRRSVGTGAAR